MPQAIGQDGILWVFFLELALNGDSSDLYLPNS
jgi:hypothetical protein